MSARFTVELDDGTRYDFSCADLKVDFQLNPQEIYGQGRFPVELARGFTRVLIEGCVIDGTLTKDNTTTPNPALVLDDFKRRLRFE